MAGPALAATNVDLTPMQKQLVQQSVSDEPRQKAPSTFIVGVGQPVPNQLTLMALPDKVTAQIPSLKTYDFAKLRTGRILIVDPDSRSVVAIVG